MALQTAAATVGAEAACLVVFYGVNVLVGFAGGAAGLGLSEEEEVEVVRSRSRGQKRT
ncbi:hypothetical protein LTR53_019652, partial [Teratosphaeriaceae sp. CCFEE 6253]